MELFASVREMLLEYPLPALHEGISDKFGVESSGATSLESSYCRMTQNVDTIQMTNADTTVHRVDINLHRLLSGVNRKSDTIQWPISEINNQQTNNWNSPKYGNEWSIH